VEAVQGGRRVASGLVTGRGLIALDRIVLPVMVDITPDYGRLRVAYVPPCRSAAKNYAHLMGAFRESENVARLA